MLLTGLTVFPWIIVLQEIYDEVPEDDETGRTQIVEPEQETYEVPDEQHDQSISETYEVPDQPDEQETYEEPDQQETYEVPEEPGVCTSIHRPVRFLFG